MIYVASSWRNPYYNTIRDILRALYTDEAVYDFKAGSFRWRNLLDGVPAADESDRVQGPERHIEVDASRMNAFLTHPEARAHFVQDFEALRASDTLVLVLPCGRSAHSEYGWAVGRALNTIIYQPDPIEPELMYSWADWIVDNRVTLIRALATFGYRAQYGAANAL